jgi:hypothetical protein
MPSILREPLLHFLVLGAAIFALFTALDEGAPPAASGRIAATEADAERFARDFESTWRRPPTEDELAELIDVYVREEVLVREAMALGLDRGDAVIRERLAQKMTFLIESEMDALKPTDAELSAHMAAHRERFARPALVSFEQMPLKPGTPEEAILAAVRAGTFAEELAAKSLLPGRLQPSPRQVVDATFGAGFFDAVAAHGPGPRPVAVKSAHGTHLVRVLSFEPARLPALDEIRDEVNRDWRASRRAGLVEDRLDALIALYDVARPDAEPTR